MEIRSGLIGGLLAGSVFLSIFVIFPSQLLLISSLTPNLGETLGIEVQPSDVRLKTEEDMPYKWQIDDPALEPLFQKHLSKHSVGTYILLHRRVGQTFYAVRPEKVFNHTFYVQVERAKPPRS